MHIWTIEDWVHHLDYDNYPYRTGLRLRFEKGVYPEVRRSLIDFCRWLRKEYFFPIRIIVYVKAACHVIAKNGDRVYGTCLLPETFHLEPFIRLATGDYLQKQKKWDTRNALVVNLDCLAHELTHYFQWINDIELTPIGEERQATTYAGYVIYEYLDTVDEP